jgi:hypothetical protein
MVEEEGVGPRCLTEGAMLSHRDRVRRMQRLTPTANPPPRRCSRSAARKPASCAARAPWRSRRTPGAAAPGRCLGGRRCKPMLSRRGAVYAAAVGGSSAGRAAGAAAAAACGVGGGVRGKGVEWVGGTRQARSDVDPRTHSCDAQSAPCVMMIANASTHPAWRKPPQLREQHAAGSRVCRETEAPPRSGSSGGGGGGGGRGTWQPQARHPRRRVLTASVFMPGIRWSAVFKRPREL